MVTTLREGVYHVDATANVYLVASDGLTLIDAGTPGDAATIREAIDTLGYAVSDVDRVLLTHYDYDHVGGLSRLALDAPVYAHRPDAAYLAGDDRPGLWPHKALFQRLSGLFLDRPELPIEIVSDGETVAGFEAYHTPGHNPGHLAWIEPTMETAFLGDLVRETDGRLRPSPWLVSYDTSVVARSIRRLSRDAPSFAVAGMGHGEPITTDASTVLARLAAAV